MVEFISDVWPLSRAKAAEPARAATFAKADSRGVPVRSRARHTSLIRLSFCACVYIIAVAAPAYAAGD